MKAGCIDEVIGWVAKHGAFTLKSTTVTFLQLLCPKCHKLL